MVYVFDSSSFIVIGHYFPDNFPSFWQLFDYAISERQIVSVREAYRELDNRATRQHLLDWVNKNKDIFLVPSPEETQFVAEIFSERHFQQLIKEKHRLTASPVADPFIVASAKVRNACVVTEESFKKNAARIPNVCDHYGIEWVTIQGFMDKEQWRF